MALEVVGAGFGRTGTMSLKRAPERLGLGPCHHPEEIFAHPEQAPHRQALAAGRTAIWDDEFVGYRSQVDWPGAHWRRELAAEYPQAKVIHTARPEEQRWKSFSETIAVIPTPDKGMSPPSHVLATMEVGASIIGPQTFGGAVTDRGIALAAYRRRAEQVRAAIPPERLLMFDVADGWRPLCRFLGPPMPTTPFPNANSTVEWWRFVKGGLH